MRTSTSSMPPAQPTRTTRVSLLTTLIAAASLAASAQDARDLRRSLTGLAHEQHGAVERATVRQLQMLAQTCHMRGDDAFRAHMADAIEGAWASLPANRAMPSMREEDDLALRSLVAGLRRAGARAHGQGAGEHDADLSYFHVEVAYGEDGPGRDLHRLGSWRGLARDASHARQSALNACWDDRLTGASCSAMCAVRQVPRYLASSRWLLQSSADAQTLTTRWVFDRLGNTLAGAQARDDAGTWGPLGQARERELLGELLDHDEILVDNTDLEEHDRLPEWAQDDPRNDERDTATPEDRVAPTARQSERRHA